jgi:hypothetical protein
MTGTWPAGSHRGASVTVVPVRIPRGWHDRAAAGRRTAGRRHDGGVGVFAGWLA